MLYISKIVNINLGCKFIAKSFTKVKLLIQLLTKKVRGFLKYFNFSDIDNSLLGNQFCIQNFQKGHVSA